MYKFKKLVSISKKVDGRNCYSILYFDETDGEIHKGFSSGNLDVISYFLKEIFINNNAERHAHWEQPSYFYEENGVFQCSNCKEEFVLISGSPKENEYEYCPHCGCKMDEVTDKDMKEKE